MANNTLSYLLAQLRIEIKETKNGADDNYADKSIIFIVDKIIKIISLPMILLNYSTFYATNISFFFL